MGRSAPPASSDNFPGILGITHYHYSVFCLDSKEKNFIFYVCITVKNRLYFKQSYLTSELFGGLIMINTRFGSEVTVVGGDIDKGEIDVIRKVDGKLLQGWINEYKADGGIQEIVDAINKANEKTTCGGLKNDLGTKKT